MTYYRPLTKHLDFQILFLDVEMPRVLAGIETAARVREIDMEDVCIIFVSHYPQYMQDSFNVRAFWYLSKAIDLSGHCHDPK